MSDLFAAPLTKRRSQRWLAIFLVLAIVGLPTQAQKKEFTKQQLLRTGFPDGVIEKLPVISGWQDDLNYIISKPESGGTFVVNVKTGKETPYTPPAPKRPASVYVQRNDLYLKTADGTEKRLTQTPDDREVNPQLSPDENYVAYTRNNDLYVFDIINNKENRITHDGSDVILNGYSSWVYMEEILGRFTRHKAFWWSPDSKSLVFFRSDDSNVPLFTITDADGQNGYVEKMHYPKAGDPNPEVKIGIVSPDGGAITWADFNAKDDQYFGT
ncbi:MAG TPA: DPP IV N-terminal domain-containing protein, partial [Parasegetibacter sp.]